MDDMLDPVAQRHARRNFNLGVVNGALYTVFETITSGSMVLPLFVSQLTQSPLLIGLVQPIVQSGWFLPQFLLSSYVQRRPRKQIFYHIGVVTRVGVWALIVLAIFGLGNNPPLLLAVFLVLLVMFSLSSGIGGLSFMDIVAKTVPPRRRGQYFGARNLFGGILAFGAGFAVKAILGETERFPFPSNFGILFGLAWILMSIALISFSLVIEPDGPASEEKVSLREQLARAWQLPRRDPDYRRFLFMRMSLIAAEMATPFYIIYAEQGLNLPPSIVGIYLSVSSAAGILSNVAWSRISDRRSNKLLMQLCIAVGAAAPLLALLAPTLLLVLPAGVVANGFVLVFIAFGAYVAGANIGNMNLILEIAPPAERPLYLGLSNTLLGIMWFLTGLGGVVAEFAGLQVLFALALACFGVGFLQTVPLRDPREARSSADLGGTQSNLGQL